jgi:hypothetical protein
MTADLRVDRRTSNVAKVVGSPRFRLLEIESIDMSSDGRASVSYNTFNQRQFGTVEWDRVVEANGDFSVLGVQIKKAPPLPNFEEFVQESQRRTRLNARQGSQ